MTFKVDGGAQGNDFGFGAIDTFGKTMKNAAAQQPQNQDMFARGHHCAGVQTAAHGAAETRDYTMFSAKLNVQFEIQAQIQVVQNFQHGASIAMGQAQDTQQAVETAPAANLGGMQALANALQTLIQQLETRMAEAQPKVQANPTDAGFDVAGEIDALVEDLATLLGKMMNKAAGQDGADAGDAGHCDAGKLLAQLQQVMALLQQVMALFQQLGQGLQAQAPDAGAGQQAIVYDLGNLAANAQAGGAIAYGDKQQAAEKAVVYQDLSIYMQAAFELQAQAQGGGEALPEVAVENGRVWGDPHFVGADGGNYDVQGEAGKTYNILSDKGIQVNARFDEWAHPGSGMTVMGAMGVTLGDDQLQVEKDGSVSINGEQVGPGHYLDGQVEVTEDGKVKVNEEEYSFELHYQHNSAGNHWNMENIRSDNAAADGVMPSGLWGGTVDGDGHARHGDQGSGTQGGGAIETADGGIAAQGDRQTFRDYEVGGLFDTNFGHHNKYDAAGAGGAGGAGYNFNLNLDLSVNLQAGLNVGAEQKTDIRDLPEMKSEGNYGYFLQHGEYTKLGDGEYQIDSGAYAGYSLKWNAEFNLMVVYNPEGHACGVTDGKGGKDKVASPIAFDLNGDGQIGVTGETSAKDRNAGTQMGETVQFDIDGDGSKDTIEWMAGDGDALLVDNRDGNAAGDMDGARLFGDQGGQYAHGYEKLAQLDKNGDGELTDDELLGLALWQDDGDAQVEDGEMISALDAGIERISVEMGLEKNARGEDLMRSDATINGERVMSEDVWFGKDG